jgi:hypothetical protein
MNLPPADRKKLASLLDELGRAVEDLVLSGLTTASEATRRTLGVAFQEASRLRLLRLGSTLRAASDELGRFTRNEPDFSRKRLCFFLNRAWLLSHGLARALAKGDDSEFDRLLWTPASEPFERLDVVTLGVAKKVVAGAFCAFDFRLRTTQAAGKIPTGCRLLWSCVFPTRQGVDIPAEGFLHLPQKQRFTASLFLEGKSVVLAKIAVALDEFGGGRISLGDQSTVAAGEAFSDWARFQTWDSPAAIKRIGGHKPSPFDLEVEMQEEIVLTDWQMDEPVERDGQKVYHTRSGASQFDAVVSPGIEGQALDKALDEVRKKKDPPPLFGLLHYEKCRLILQPLSLFDQDGMRHLTISDEKVERKKLLQALKF